MAVILICRLLASILISDWTEAYEYFSVASQLELAGKYDEAIVFYEKARELAPYSTEVYLSLTGLYYQLRNYRKGIMVIKEAIEKFDPDIELYNMLAVGYIGQAEYEKAVEVYEKALAHDSGNVLIYSSLSILYEAMRQPKKAQDILLIMPDSLLTTEIYTRLAAVSGRMNKPEEAISYYHMAHELDSANIAAITGIATAFDIMQKPDSAIYYYELALHDDSLVQSVGRRLVELYAEVDRYDRLIPVATKLLALNYYDVHMRRNLAFAYYKMGYNKIALSEFHITSRLDPQDTYSRFYAGRIYLEDGLHNSALKEINNAIRINPLFIELWVYRAFIAIEMKTYTLAEQSLSQAAYYGGDLVQIYYLLGAVNEMQGHEYDAHRFYSKGLMLNPKNLPNLEALANLYARLDKERKATEIFSRIIEIDTTNASALNYVGYHYAEKAESLDYALGLINRALHIEPQNAFFIDSRGWVYYQMGEYDKALADLLKASEIEHDAVILDHIGDVYVKLNDPGNALINYFQALELDPGNKKIKRKIKNLRD